MLPVNLENIGSYQMKAKYDAEVDVLTITWHDTPVEESEAISPGVILDYDQAGNVIGIEILREFFSECAGSYFFSIKVIADPVVRSLIL